MVLSLSTTHGVPIVLDAVPMRVGQLHYGRVYAGLLLDHSLGVAELGLELVLTVGSGSGAAGDGMVAVAGGRAAFRASTFSVVGVGGGAGGGSGGGGSGAASWKAAAALSLHPDGTVGYEAWFSAAAGQVVAVTLATAAADDGAEGGDVTSTTINLVEGGSSSSSSSSSGGGGRYDPGSEWYGIHPSATFAMVSGLLSGTATLTALSDAAGELAATVAVGAAAEAAVAAAVVSNRGGGAVIQRYSAVLRQNISSPLNPDVGGGGVAAGALASTGQAMVEIEDGGCPPRSPPASCLLASGCLLVACLPAVAC
jgi:hypothetical protein